MKRLLFRKTWWLLNLLLIGIILTFSTVSLPVESRKQKVVKVSTKHEFQRAVGDFVTIQLMNDIVIPFKNSSTTDVDSIRIVRRRGLVIEGNGFKVDGESKNVPKGDIGPSAITIIGGDITIKELVVTNFDCYGGSLLVTEGAKVSITNSVLSKNRNSCAGLLVIDYDADQTGKFPCNVVLSNVTIDENSTPDYADSSSDWGGGLSAIGQYRGTDRTTLTMINCKVTNNLALISGGGLYVNGADVFLEGVLFQNNIDGTRKDLKNTANDVYADNNAHCHDCWSSLVNVSPCPEKEFTSVDEGPISLVFSPNTSSPPANPRSYLCIPK